MATASLAASSSRNTSKLALWGIFAILGLSVVFFYDLPIALHPEDPAHHRMFTRRFFLIPHALTAVPAMLIGPIQFSSRLRRRYLNLHRLLGKIYICCVMVAAPTAIGMTLHGPRVLLFASATQSALWVAFTLAAFITARNRQIAQHRQWMVRSYGVGCTVFVFTRVLQLIPAVAPKGPDDLGINIMFFMLLALAVPSFYFGWHELTTGKPKAARQ